MKNKDEKGVSCQILRPKRKKQIAKKQIAIKNEHSLKYVRIISP